MPGQVLIVDSVATNRIALRAMLAEACYDVLMATSGAAAMIIAARRKPDLILYDINMADVDGIAACQRLKADPETSDIPVIMITTPQNERQKLAALRAGAEDLLTKPLDQSVLLARVRSLLRARQTEQELALRDGTRRLLGLSEESEPFALSGQLAIVSTDRAYARSLADTLPERFGMQVATLSREDAMSLRRSEQAPDVIAIAAQPGQGAGALHLLADLRAHGATRNSAILMMLPPEAQDNAAIALDLGANDLLCGTFDPEELALRAKTLLQRKQTADRLRSSVKKGLKLAATDPLTGLFNRRYAMAHLSRMRERLAMGGRPFAVLMADLDRFKSINDTYGHAGGDAVLIAVAQRLGSTLRPADLIARIGGEEFVIALPDQSLAQAERTAERLRQSISDMPVSLGRHGDDIQVSASIGVAMATDPTEPLECILGRADQALYTAKAQGRNLVHVFSGSSAA